MRSNATRFFVTAMFCEVYGHSIIDLLHGQLIQFIVYSWMVRDLNLYPSIIQGTDGDCSGKKVC